MDESLTDLQHVLLFRRRESYPWLLRLALAGLLLGILALARVVFAQSPGDQTPVQSFEQEMLTALLGLLTAGATWSLTHLGLLIAAHTKNAYLLGVWSRAQAAALTAVQTVEQTAAKDLSGKPLDAATAATLKADALTLLRQLIGPAGLTALGKIVGVDQLEQALGALVESKVLTATSKATVGASAVIGSPAVVSPAAKV